MRQYRIIQSAATGRTDIDALKRDGWTEIKDEKTIRKVVKAIGQRQAICSKERGDCLFTREVSDEKPTPAPEPVKHVVKPEKKK